MNYTWATASHIGHLRDGNEDSVSPVDDGTDTGPILIAVADGMGGHVAGEVASSLAIQAATDSEVDIDTEIGRRVELANEAVIKAANADTDLTGMGTTLTIGLFETDGTLQIGHVGDSRLYLLRNNKLVQVTQDHTWVAGMIADGRLTDDAARKHPQRHLLTRVLGMPSVEADSEEINLEEGDRILICSDGLTTMLGDTSVESIAANAKTPSDAAWSLIEAANAAGGYDNTTVAVVDVAS